MPSFWFSRSRVDPKNLRSDKLPGGTDDAGPGITPQLPVLANEIC